MITNWTAVNNVTEILQVPMNTTSGFFYVGVLVLVFFILLISLAGFGIEVAILASAFVALIAGVLLVYMQLMAWGWLLPFFALILFLFLYITWSSNRDSM